MNSAVPAPVLTELDATVLRIRVALQQNKFQDVVRDSQQALAGASGHRELLYFLAVAQRMQTHIPEALETLATLESYHPSYPRLFQERGHCHVFRREAPEAIRAYEHAVRLNPALPASWKALQTLYRIVGRPDDSEVAGQHVAILSALALEITTARSMLEDGNLREAEDLIRPYLARNPKSVEALRLLANIARQSEVANDAEALLAAVLDLAPDYNAARYDYVLALVDLQKHRKALVEVNKLIAADPRNLANKVTRAGILIGLGELEQAVASYRNLVEALPGDPELVQSLGHALKTMGRQAEAIAAYQQAINVRPGFGEAYWSLANLKTYRFSDEELTRMRRDEALPTVQPADRFHLCFALAKALEDRGAYAESFTYLDRGNALKKKASRYRADIQEKALRRQREICTAEFFAARTGWGFESAAPIFIVGLPRAGSTLLEQILASHSRVEGTMELANVPRLVGSLGGHEPWNESRYPDVLADLTAQQCREFGEAYLRDTLDYRTGKPLFIDKMPNNFRNVALIHLMLPNAKIIDARRDPMDCCFSNFKQLYATGHPFSYSLEDVGRYYSSYVGLMGHWDRVLPGRILRVLHEDVLDDLEGSVRRLLNYCGLLFEPACVVFYNTQRRVHTASSEQVRRPINRDGVGQWRNFEPWLGPLRAALGPLQT